MDEIDLKYHLCILIAESYIDDKKILKSLKKISKDNDTLKEAKKSIMELKSHEKKSLKENVAATLHKNDEYEQASMTYLTTFIVVLVFTIWDSVVSLVSEGSFSDAESKILLSMILNFVLFVVLAIGVYIFLRKFKKPNLIYQYKLISFIENLEIDSDSK